jgi:fatty acid desaturase
VLLEPGATSRIPPAAFDMAPAERRAIALELLAITGLHAAVIGWIGLAPLPLLMGYFLPIWIGYAGSIAYIYTNHLLCPLTESNDPLVNTLSIRVPGWLDLLHMNFSHHVEHHIFPGLHCDAYPLVRRLLLEQFPERFHPLEAAEAWRLLLTTPRHYGDGDTLVSADGRCQVPALRVPPDCGSG